MKQLLEKTSQLLQILFTCTKMSTARATELFLFTEFLLVAITSGVSK